MDYNTNSYFLLYDISWSILASEEDPLKEQYLIISEKEQYVLWLTLFLSESANAPCDTAAGTVISQSFPYILDHLGQLDPLREGMYL